jgi:glycosyltransferase involved in cell wall biosynthesis
MSTHNGERYVAEQVDSVLAQTHPTVRLLVRDDGSRDGTVDVLRRYANDPRVSLVEGENLGLPHAFFRLIDMADDDAEYWALCDQDDVWVPDKLARAVASLAPLGNSPALHCARVLVTDERLRPLYAHPLPRRGPSFANALVQNIATGCTIVFNRAARDVLRSRWPEFCVMHDAWIYLVVAGTGTVVYDPEPAVRYRQHDRNAVGVGSGPVARFAGRVRRQLRAGGAGQHGRQDRELLRLFADVLTPQARRQAEDLLATRRTARGRLRYALTGEARRQTAGSDLVMRALGVVGRL